MAHLIAVEHLSKTFKLSSKQQRIEHTKLAQRVAVDDLSFSVDAGEIFGLLGPNGAGKTTALRMLATLIKPDSGDASVAGHSITADPEGVRASIGFLTTDLKLEDFFTPNYLFEFFSRLHGVPQELIAQRRQHLFEHFGIAEFAEVKVADLSQGMRQKTSLVISIVHDPDIIIFDEPTNGLDIITARTVTDYLLELRDQGKTVILSTHIFSLATKLCNRIGIIIDGRMVALGTLDEVTGGADLEDCFFDLYVANSNREVV